MTSSVCHVLVMDSSRAEHEKATAFDLEQTLEKTGLLCMITVVANAFLGLEAVQASNFSVVFVADNMADMSSEDTIRLLQYADVKPFVLPVHLSGGRTSVFKEISKFVSAIQQGILPQIPKSGLQPILPWLESEDEVIAPAARALTNKRYHAEAHCKVVYKAEAAKRPKQLTLDTVVSASILQSPFTKPLPLPVLASVPSTPVTAEYAMVENLRLPSPLMLEVEDEVDNNEFFADGFLEMFELFPEDIDQFIFQPIGAINILPCA